MNEIKLDTGFGAFISTKKGFIFIIGKADPLNRIKSDVVFSVLY